MQRSDKKYLMKTRGSSQWLYLRFSRGSAGSSSTRKKNCEIPARWLPPRDGIEFREQVRLIMSAKTCVGLADAVVKSRHEGGPATSKSHRRCWHVGRDSAAMSWPTRKFSIRNGKAVGDSFMRRPKVRRLIERRAEDQCAGKARPGLGSTNIRTRYSEDEWGGRVIEYGLVQHDYAGAKGFPCAHSTPRWGVRPRDRPHALRRGRPSPDLGKRRRGNCVAQTGDIADRWGGSAMFSFEWPDGTCCSNGCWPRGTRGWGRARLLSGSGTGNPIPTLA